MGPEQPDNSFVGKLSFGLITLQIRTRRFFRWASSPTSPVLALAAGAYGACILLQDRNFPRGDWEPGTAGGYVLLGSGAVAFMGAALLGMAYHRTLTRAQGRDDLAETCKALWAFVIEELQLPMHAVGAHVFTIKGFKGAHYFEKRATFIIERRRASKIVWRLGCGAVGVACKEEMPIIANVENLDERVLRRVEISNSRQELERRFLAIPYLDRYGLGFREYFRTRHYRAVLAVPLRTTSGANDKIRNCLAVDLQVDGHADALADLLDHEYMADIIAICEDILDNG